MYYNKNTLILQKYIKIIEKLNVLLRLQKYIKIIDKLNVKSTLKLLIN